MVTEDIAAIAGFIFLAGFFILERYIYPIIRTSPPADKIIKLVKSQDGFKIHPFDYNAPEDLNDSIFIKWTIEDTVTGKLTWANLPFNRSSIELHGDLEWMNPYEQYRLYRLVDKMGKKVLKARLAELDREEEQYNSELREKAKEVYKNR